MKKIMLLCLLSAALLSTGCNRNKPTESEPLPPGVEESVFGENGEVTQQEEVQPQATATTEPTKVEVPDKPSATTGIVAPDEPDDVSPAATPVSTATPVPTQAPTPAPTATVKPTTAPSQGTPDAEQLDYQQFHALSPADQQKVMESFDDIEAFFEWYNDMQEQYEAENPPIIVDGGTVDMDAIINGSN